MAFPTIQPESAPEFFHWSKPIQEPKPDLSKATLFKGVGDAIEEGVKGLNKAAEEQATATGYEAGQQKQSEYGDVVQAMHQTLFPQDVVDPNQNTLTPNPNATGYDESKVPQPVKDGVQTAQNIKAARDQGQTPGHLRETMYYQQLYQKASELRAQWPGYRDYIDKGFEKATGITPNANAYIKSMLADINETLTKKNAAGEKVDTKLLDAAAAGNQYAGTLYNAKKAGKIDEEYAVNELAKSEAFRYAHQYDSFKLNRLDLNSKEAEQTARDNISKNVTGQVQSGIDTHMRSLGLTPDKMQDIVDGKIQLKPEEWEALDKSLTQLELQTRSQFRTQHAQDGTIAALKDNYNSAMDEAFRSFKGWHDAIRNQDTGYLGTVSRANKYASDQQLSNVWRAGPGNPAAEFFKKTELFHKFGGDNFSATVLQGNSVPKPEELTALMGNAMGRSTTPGLQTMKQTLTAINSIPGGGNKETNQAYLKFPITAVMRPDVPDEAKVSVLNHVFHGNDNDWLSNINDDYTINGVRVSGKHDVYLAYTNPQFKQQIEKLSVHNPQLMNDYQQWVQRTFANDLFSKDIAKLPDLQNNPGIDLVWVHGEKNQAPRFEARPSIIRQFTQGMSDADQAQRAREAATSPVIRKRIDGINENLRNLNDGIKGIYNVTGENTTPTLMRLFGSMGIDTTGTPTTAGMLLGAVAARPPIAGSKKDQSPAPSPTQIARPQGTMNQANPSIATNQPGLEGTPGGPGPYNLNTIKQKVLNSPMTHYPEDLHNAYKNVKDTMSTFIDRFEAAFGDAAQNYKKTKIFNAGTP